MRIRRGALPSDNFTVVPNDLIERADLSWAAKGLYVWLAGRPPGWNTTIERIAETNCGGEFAVRSAMTQLQKAGLIARTRYRDDHGQWQQEVLIGGEPDAKTAHGLTREPAINAAALIAPLSKTEEQENYARREGLFEEPGPEPPRGESPSSSQQALEQTRTIFDAWAASLGAPGNRTLTDSRKAAIRKALKSWPAEDLIDAVQGWRHDPWPGRAEQNSIEILLRPANIEKFRDLQRAHGDPDVEPEDDDVEGWVAYWEAHPEKLGEFGG